MSKMPRTLGLVQPEELPKKSKMNVFGVLAVFVVIAGLVVILIVFGAAAAKFLSAMLTR